MDIDITNLFSQPLFLLGTWTSSHANCMMQPYPNDLTVVYPRIKTKVMLMTVIVEYANQAFSDAGTMT